MTTAAAPMTLGTLVQALAVAVPTLVFAALCGTPASPSSVNPTAPAISSTAAPRALQTIPLDVPVPDAPYAFYFIGIEKGYYAEEGLQLEFVASNGNTSVASLLAGEMPFTTAASAVLAATLKGGEMKVVLTNMDRPAYEIWSSQPDIRTLADLKDKVVGVISRGDSLELSTRLALTKAGLSPDSVAYTALGAGAARLAAVQSGAVAAGVLGIADVQKLKLSGAKGNQVMDLSREVRMLFNGVATTDRLLKQDPGLVTRFLRATIKSREYFKQFKNETLAIVAKRNNAPLEVNEPDYDSIRATLTEDGSIPEETQVVDAAVRAAAVGAPTVRPVKELYDYSIARAVFEDLKRSGWQPQR